MEHFYKNFSETFFSNFAWFVISTVVIVILLPIYSDWRRFRKQKLIRRMVGSRISRVNECLRAYLNAIHNVENKFERTQELLDLYNAIHHMMEVPKHFTSALWGEVGRSYYEFRVISTNIAATATLAMNDYDKYFTDIFFTHAKIPASSIKELDETYRACLQALGEDIHTAKVMQPVINAWSKSDIDVLENVYSSLHKGHNKQTPP